MFDDPFWDLPDHMARPQIEACQRYFGRYMPGKQFAPGAPGFSSQFCADLYRRTHDGRHDECSIVRDAVCRLAVRDGEFASLRACIASTPPVRVVIRESPRLTALVSEPAAFDGTWLASNTRDRWFPDPDFRVEFHGTKRQAWDSRLGAVVPWPADLTEHLAQSPNVQVLDRRTINLGGADARLIDLFVTKSDTNAVNSDMCGEQFIRDVPCLPITADPDVEGYVSWWLDPGDVYRLIDVATSTGRVVVSIEVDDPAELAGTERILKTLRVG